MLLPKSEPPGIRIVMAVWYPAKVRSIRDTSMMSAKDSLTIKSEHLYSNGEYVLSV